MPTLNSSPPLTGAAARPATFGNKARTRLKQRIAMICTAFNEDCVDSHKNESRSWTQATLEPGWLESPEFGHDVVLDGKPAHPTRTPLLRGGHRPRHTPPPKQNLPLGLPDVARRSLWVKLLLQKNQDRKCCWLYVRKYCAGGY